MNTHIKRALLAGSVVFCAGIGQAQSSGPEVYIGRVLVSSAEPATGGSCGSLAAGNSYGAILRVPSASPTNWKLEILSDQFGARIKEVDATEAAITLLSETGQLSTGTLAIKSGGVVTSLPAGPGGNPPAVELAVTVNERGECKSGYFVVASLSDLP